MPKLTKRFIETEIQAPDSGQTIYRDNELPGFALRVTAKSKSYIVERRVNGANCRLTLGKHADMSVEEARNRARIILGEMAKGNDPRSNRQSKSCEVTLAEALEKYLAVKTLRLRTQRDYAYYINVCLSDWRDKPIVSITKDMVETRHQELTKASTRLGTLGHARANGAMKALRSLMNFASDRYGTDDEPLIKVNPVDRLSRNKAWHHIPERQGIIQDSKLRDWYRAIVTAKNDVARDYFIFVLLTGLRRGESLRLRWSHIDFEQRMLIVPRELTKSDREHRLPLTDFLMELLNQRYSKRVNSEWVFQSAKDRTKHICELSYTMREVRAKCGLTFQVHDLRRTFLTMAEKLDVPHYALKRLVNHQVGKDVTGRYIILDIERLRMHMNKISEAFVALLGADVHDLGEWKRKDKADLHDGRQLQFPIEKTSIK